MISDLNAEKLQEVFTKKNCKKLVKKKLYVKRKSYKLYVKLKGYANSFNSWINEKDLVLKNLVLSHRQNVFIVRNKNYEIITTNNV